MDAHTIAIAFGRALRGLRTEAQLTQEQFGFAADLQRNYVSELELGQKLPSVLTLFKVSYALGLRPERFVKLIDDELKSHTVDAGE